MVYKYISENQKTKLVKLTEKEKLTEKQKEEKDQLDQLQIKNDLYNVIVNYFKQFEQPHKAKRDGLSKILKSKSYKLDVYKDYFEVENFSELREKFLEEIGVIKLPTKQELIDDLDRIAERFHNETFQSKFDVTREYWRKYTKLHHASPEELFGSFSELKDNIPGRLERKGINIVIPKSNTSGKHLYIITSVMPEAKLHKGVFTAIRKMMEVESKARFDEVKLYTLNMRGMHNSHKYYDPEVVALSDHFATEIEITSKIKALDMNVFPTEKDPLNQVELLCDHPGQSIIIAHPVQRIRAMDSGDIKSPRIALSTGTITPRSYPKTRAGYIGNLRMALGFVAIEVDTNTGYFYWRQVEANADGSFNYMNTYYSCDGSIKDAEASLIAIGDLHPPWTLDYARKASFEMVNYFGVDHVTLSDSFDAHSISHHHEFNFKLKLQKVKDPRFVYLKNELDEYAEELKRWNNNIDKSVYIWIKPSNHNEHLDRYLNEKRYEKENPPVNWLIANELATKYYDNINPLQYYIETYHPELKNRFEWLARGDDRFIANTLVSNHGDEGPRGKPMTDQAGHKVYGSAIFDHLHAPAKYNDIYRNGTIAVDMPYAQGKPGNWHVGNTILYKNGQKQFFWIDQNGRFYA